MKESAFQASLIRRIKSAFPGCIVLKNDANYIQGFPDLLILYRDKWAALECKRSGLAQLQPNQIYYIRTLSEMSFSAVVYPENELMILDELRIHFSFDLFEQREVFGKFIQLEGGE